MRQDEARERILHEWHSWVTATNTNNPSGRDGLRFFTFLQKEREYLLEFRASGDKWQIVHGWLSRARLVSD
jgi:hypothetical protein